MSSIFPKRGRQHEMSTKTKVEICKLIDEYMASIGATLIHEAKPGTEVPGTSGKEWSYMTRFGVNMRVAAHGQWVYMSFGYSNDREYGDAGMKRMREVLGGPNSDGRFNEYSGKYNLWVASNAKPTDALSIFKGDMSLFKQRSIDDITEQSVKLEAQCFIARAQRAYGKQDPAKLAANAIRLMIHHRGLDTQSYLEHEEVIRQVMKTCLADVAL